jgi:hypothetical protein
MTVLALQRRAGNAAVSALLAGRSRAEGEAADRMDSALRQLRTDDPSIDVVETGLKEAKAAGVPVDLEGTPPPASALAVTTTGFGPAAVAPKKPPVPPKPVPPHTALGKAAARGAKDKGATGKPGGAATRGTAAPAGAGTATTPVVGGVAGLAPDQLLQPPVPPVGIRPEQDPAFAAVTRGIGSAATTARAHGPAAAKAKEAQDAAVAPPGDLSAQAEAAKVDAMDAQQPGSFDKKAFIAAVKGAIEAKSPKTLKEADEYAESGKAEEVKGSVAGLVTEGKGEQTKDIATAAGAPPDQSKAVPKEVVPMAGEPVGRVPSVPAAGAVPKPAPPEQTNLQAGKHQADAELASADVTEEQLTRSNEPEFQQAVEDKKVAAEHADTAPGQFREQEQQVIQQDRAEATAGVSATVAGMQGTRAAALAGLVADKTRTKDEDEGRRGEVTAKVQAIYAVAEQDVRAILEGIDPKVEQVFGEGEAAARQAFEAYVDTKMSAYKKDRYGGWLGGLRWAKDKLLGMPSKVDAFYEAGRELYLKRMDGVISRVADIVGGDLTRAKKRIAAGKAEIAAYVKKLPADLRKTGAKAAEEIGDRFDSLEGEVAAKQESTVDALASKYVESRKGLDERIEALQAANKGLVDKAIGAIKGVINTIRELAAMLKNALSRVAGVVGQIIKDPVGFLGNLIAGVKGGILKFKDHIVDHLRNGLMGWLFGALAEGGVELPESFDLKGVIKLLASIFGLTWARIRTRIVRQIGAPAMAAAEKGVEVFQVLAAQGVGGLWQMLVDKLGDLKEMILEKVKDFVVTKIIVAGITWLIGLLNPAAAFIKACKLIYDVVMFFVSNASRIADFVNTVIDSVAEVVRGNVGGVVEKINQVLGKMVPILIGFLASVIGLGGIGKKVREIVTALQKPVTRAIDAVVKKGLQLAAPLIRGLKRLGGRVKAKVLGGDDSPAGKADRLRKGMSAAVSAANRYAGRRVGAQALRPALGAIRLRYGLGVLEPLQQGNRWAVRGQVQRTTLLTQAEAADLAAIPGLRPEELEYFRSRVPQLPERSTRGPYDQPRGQARTAVNNLERGVRNPQANLERLKDIFRLHGRPRVGPVPEAPRGGQQIRARIRVRVEPGATPLEMGGTGRPAGTGERAPRGGGYELFNWDPSLKTPEGGEKVGRGAVYTSSNVRNDTGVATQTDILTRSWATGGNDPHQANTNHTENQLAFWLDQQGEGFLARVIGIEMHSTYSPCSTCVDVLRGIRGTLDGHRGENPPASLMISWQQWYGPAAHQASPRRQATQTTVQDIINLERARWRTSGPRR